MYNVKAFSYKRLIYTILMNTALLLVALFVFVPFFEEIDDTHIAMIAEGAYGMREWHLIYPNIILGKLYASLYEILPSVRWHSVLQYALIYFAYVTTTYVISKRKYGYIISFLAVSATFYEMYVSLQYTKTAAFLTAAGLILIYEYVRNDDSKTERIIYLCFSAIFLIIGGLLRPEAFLIACIPMFFVGCIELWRSRHIVRYVAVLIPIFAAVLMCIVINGNAYNKDSEWSDFMRYNKARMQLTDYRYDILHYPSNGDELKKLNVSENDAWMIVTYQFGDDNIFTTDYMEKIRNDAGNKPFTFQVFRNLWESVGNEIKRCSVIIPVMICLIILLITTIISNWKKSDNELAVRESRIMLTAMFGIGLFSAAALIYFQYSGRWSHRLAAALVIPVIYALCYMIDFSFHAKEGKNVSAGSIIILTSLIISILFNIVSYRNNIREYAGSLEIISAKNQVLKHFENNPETLYVIDTFTFQNSFKYDVFNPISLGQMKNVVSCGSWFMNSPITKAVCGRFGYSNPYEAMLDTGGSVVLLDTYFPDEKALFLTEHYNKLYNAVNIGNINNISEYVMEISQ